MAKQKKLTPELQAWVDARRRFHLSHAHVQMARELGMNPKKLGGMANHRQKSWKVPLPQYVEELYLKRFKKERPDDVRSVEQIVADRERKRAEHREPKAPQQDAAHPANPAHPPASSYPEETTDDDIPF